MPAYRAGGGGVSTGGQWRIERGEAACRAEGVDGPESRCCTVAMRQWQVDRAAGLCNVTGRALEEGEEFYTVLFEDGESFRRADYSLDAWQGPPDGSSCHFKTRVPVKKKAKQLLVGNEALVTFFVHLADESEPIRVQFRFVLALILMRKRILRYEGTRSEDGAEIWDMTLTREQTRHRVINPKLTDDQVESVSRELTAILHGDMQPLVEECERSSPQENGPAQEGDDAES